MNQSNHIKQYVKAFENFEANRNRQYAYILTHDGHRDSATLDKCAINEEGMITIITEEAKELGDEIIAESVQINYDINKITYSYKDSDGDIQNDGYWGFFKLKIV